MELPAALLPCSEAQQLSSARRVIREGEYGLTLTRRPLCCATHSPWAVMVTVVADGPPIDRFLTQEEV